MKIKAITSNAVCKCPHNGQLEFGASQSLAKGADGELLLLKDLMKATVRGCSLPPNAGGPCTAILTANDPFGNKIKVRGEPIVTEKVVAITDKGYPVRVEDPGDSRISVSSNPDGPDAKKASFLASAAASTESASDDSSPPESKGKILSAFWNVPAARRGDVLALQASTENFLNGEKATFRIYEYDSDGNHDFIAELEAKVERGMASTQWAFRYDKDTDDILSREESEIGYNPPEYFFELEIGKKTARSVLLEFKDWIEFELKDQERRPIPNICYIAYLPDGIRAVGRLDSDGCGRLEDVPPGKVRLEFTAAPISE